MIFRSCVWFSPPQPPIKIESRDIVNIRCRYEAREGKKKKRNTVVLLVEMGASIGGKMASLVCSISQKLVALKRIAES